jgi:hypothetical protein
MPGQIALELIVTPDQAVHREGPVARGTVINAGSSDVQIPLAPLGSPSLALQIVDAQGAPVLLPPPGVPGGDWPLATLAPGERHTQEYSAFFPQWTPAGAYRVRLRLLARPTSPGADEWTGEAYSDWVDVTLTD